MVRGRDGDNIARQLVDLHKQKGHDTFDFASLVAVAALFADRVELVKKENAWHGAGVIEQPSQARVCLTQIGANQRVVPDSEELDCQRLGNSFRYGRFSVAGRPRKKDPMSRLHTVGPEQVGAVLLFDELPYLLTYRQWQNQLLQPLTRNRFQNCVFSGLGGGMRRCRRCDGYSV